MSGLAEGHRKGGVGGSREKLFDWSRQRALRKCLTSGGSQTCGQRAVVSVFSIRYIILLNNVKLYQSAKNSTTDDQIYLGEGKDEVLIC